MSTVTRIHADREPSAEVAVLRDECDQLRADLADRPVLKRSAALDLDQAELFLLSLEAETLTMDLPRSAYLLGLAEGHLANMIEIVRAVAR